MDPLAGITEGCWVALRLGLHVSAVPTGNLRVRDGVYGFGEGKYYHPLEAALVGASGLGDWRADAEMALGVDPDWVDGFLDGFAKEPESSTGGDYMQGFLAAEQLRATRFRRELPDRMFSEEVP